jgi:hypothetical protein
MATGARERAEKDIAGVSAEGCDRKQAPALSRGEGPIGAIPTSCYRHAMNPILLIILFGGGGFYVGGPAYGGGGLGLILLICIVVYLFGGFRGPKN